MDNRNYYIENAEGIRQTGIENDVPINIAIDLWDHAHPGEAEEYGAIGPQREAYYRFVAERTYDKETTED